MICVPWAPLDKGFGTPSWICPLSAAAFSSRSDRPGRQNADNLVGPLGRKNYNAARDMPAKGDLVNFPNCLSATGMIVDRIQLLGAVAIDGDIPKDWLRLADSEIGPHDSKDGIPEQFWRTLAGDRGPDGASPPSWYGRACAYTFTHECSSYVRTGNLIKAGDSSVIAEYLKRVQSVTWNRRLGTTAGCTIGIFSLEVNVGDLICILYGCSVPVVLTPVYGEGNRFRLCGECFVYGIMDGEAIGKLNAGLYKEVTFNVI
jgi:hypothetical protein